jgi:hypothetical protein
MSEALSLLGNPIGPGLPHIEEVGCLLCSALVLFCQHVLLYQRYPGQESLRQVCCFFFPTQETPLLISKPEAVTGAKLSASVKVQTHAKIASWQV